MPLLCPCCETISQRRPTTRCTPALPGGEGRRTAHPNRVDNDVEIVEVDREIVEVVDHHLPLYRHHAGLEASRAVRMAHVRPGLVAPADGFHIRNHARLQAAVPSKATERRGAKMLEGSRDSTEDACGRGKCLAGVWQVCDRCMASV